MLLLPDDLRALADSAAAAAGFVSNVYFDSRAGDRGAAETIPLLHTWSLGVEEQLLFYPLLLMAARRFMPARLPLLLALVAAASFALSLYWVGGAPNAAFYLLPSRAWELALGGLVARAPSQAPAPMRAVLALAGLGLIAVGLAFITSASAFPAPWALPPGVGAALLIAYGGGGPTDRLLASRPMRRSAPCPIRFISGIGRSLPSIACRPT